MTLIESARLQMQPWLRCIEESSLAEPVQMQAVLRAMLPQRYGVEPGSVFAAEQTPLQADGLLIFDALHRLPLGDRHPVEMVYAMCGVSLHMDEAEFDLQLRMIEQLKRMRREKATAYDVSPLHHLRMFGARYAQLSDDQINPLLGYVFAVDGIDARASIDHLNAALQSDAPRAEFSPDAIFCLRGGWMIARQTRTGELAVPRSSFGKFGLYEVGEDILTWAYLLLNTALSQIQLKAPDLVKVLQRLPKMP
jgi:hypothetical protein